MRLARGLHEVAQGLHEVGTRFAQGWYEVCTRSARGSTRLARGSTRFDLVPKQNLIGYFPIPNANFQPITL